MSKGQEEKQPSAAHQVLGLIMDECRYWHGRDEARRGGYAVLYAKAKEVVDNQQAPAEQEPVAAHPALPEGATHIVLVECFSRFAKVVGRDVFYWKADAGKWMREGTIVSQQDFDAYHYPLTRPTQAAPQPEQSDNSKALAAAQERVAELEQLSQFLLDRIRENLEPELVEDECCRQYLGHVQPAAARLSAALAKHGEQP